MEKTGRNARCPCGSGKKFKKCCQAKGIGTHYTREDRANAWAVAESLRRQPGFRDALTVVTQQDARTNLDLQRFLRDREEGSAKAHGAQGSLAPYLEGPSRFRRSAVFRSSSACRRGARSCEGSWSDQKMRWIQPYWKGPDMATIIEERTYKLKP